MSRLSPRRIRRGLTRRAWRARKLLQHLWRGVSGDAAHTSTPAFIWGCHRSGTKMLLRTLDRSLDTWTYPEHNRRAFDSGYRLRSLPRAGDLVRGSRAPVVMFKPICDSHRADRMLDHFEGRSPRGLWIYRNPDDVTNSLVAKWGNQFERVVRTILEGRPDEVGWRGERVGDGRLRTMERIVPDELSSAEGAAVFWWLRNSFYFDLGLDADTRVRLVSYDQLVRGPSEYLPPVFRFVGVPYESGFGERIHAGSVGREPAPDLSAPIREACEQMQARLVEAHAGDVS